MNGSITMQRFRAEYRAEISSSYSGWFHMLSVLVTGLLVITFSISKLHAIDGAEWLTIPITIIAVNFSEYASHRWLGHKKTKLGALFYRRHTGDHHSFFLHNHMPYESTRDWRVVLFPVYLIFAFTFGLILPVGYTLTETISTNVAYLYAASAIFGYLFYEVMHFSYHLPAGSFVERTPIWRNLRDLHAMHHRRDIMTTGNFNITLPIFDFLFGSLVLPKNNVKADRHTS